MTFVYLEIMKLGKSRNVKLRFKILAKILIFDQSAPGNSKISQLQDI